MSRHPSGSRRLAEGHEQSEPLFHAVLLDVPAPSAARVCLPVPISAGASVEIASAPPSRRVQELVSRRRYEMEGPADRWDHRSRRSSTKTRRLTPYELLRQTGGSPQTTCTCRTDRATSRGRLGRVGEDDFGLWACPRRPPQLAGDACLRTAVRHPRAPRRRESSLVQKRGGHIERGPVPSPARMLYLLPRPWSRPHRLRRARRAAQPPSPTHPHGDLCRDGEFLQIRIAHLSDAPKYECPKLIG